MNQIKNPLNQWRGKMNKATGDLFEKMIEDSCDYCRDLGEADIEKTPEPIKVRKRLQDGTFIVSFIKKAQPDFKGTKLGGRTIVFEAKHTDSSKIDQKVLTTTQWNGLKRYSELGADSYILVSIRLEKFFLVPWEVWEAMKEIYGRRYITAEEMKPYQVPFRNFVIRFFERG